MAIDSPAGFPWFPGIGLMAFVSAAGCMLDTRNLDNALNPLETTVAVCDGPEAKEDVAAKGAAVDSAGGTARDATALRMYASDIVGDEGTDGSRWRDGGTDGNDGGGDAKLEAPRIHFDASQTGEIGRSMDGASDAPVLDASLPDKGALDSVSPVASHLEQGLVGHWTFDEGSGIKVADSSGNGITGTLVNGPVWSKKCAPTKSGYRSGSCLRFNGTNQFVLLADAAVANISGAISMTAWIKMDATGVNSADQGMRNIIAHGYTNNPNAEVVVRLGNDNYVAGSWDGTEHQISSPAADDVGIWVHLATVFDGASWRLYRDGKLIAFRADNLGAMAVGQPWCIGATSSGKERFFSGFIDDVRLYNRALSVAEVVNLASGTDVRADTGGPASP